jgi:proteasome-associated ATPase
MSDADAFANLFFRPQLRTINTAGMSNREIELASLREQVRVLTEQINQMSTEPLRHAALVRKFKGHKDSMWFTLSLDGQLVDVHCTDKGTYEKFDGGDFVRVAMRNGHIVDRAEVVHEVGDGFVVKRVVDDDHVELEAVGSTRIVWCPRRFAGVKAGSRVLLDRFHQVIVRDLGPEPSGHAFESTVDVDWSHIGGLEDAKRDLREAIELPALKPELFKRYGRVPPRGVLLEGPPGCGKTMLAKAVATALKKVRGNAAEARFMYVKGPEVLDRFVGQSERKIRQLFETARDHYREHGYPAVIFIDEADALLSQRGTGMCSDMERTTVPQFLAEMDGLEAAHAFVLLATNRADKLDSAVTRDGRIDLTITVGRPDRTAVRDIAVLHLEGVPVAEPDLAEAVRDELFDDRYVLKKFALPAGEEAQLLLRDVVNGAMVRGVVQRAAAIALRRDLETGKPGGITARDVRVACGHVQAEEASKNLTAELISKAGQQLEPRRIVGAAQA